MAIPATGTPVGLEIAVKDTKRGIEMSPREFALLLD